MAIQFSLTSKAVEISVFVDDLVAEDIVVDFYGQGWRGWKCVRIRRKYGGFCFVLFLLLFFFNLKWYHGKNFAFPFLFIFGKRKC